MIGFLVMLGILISGIIHLPMGYLADRVNKKSLVIIGGLLVSYAVVSYAWSDSLMELILASAAFGIGGGICMPALMAAAVTVGDRSDAMGSVMALLTVSHSLGMLFGSMSAGLMMDVFRLRAAFPLGAILMLAGALLFMMLSREERPFHSPNRL
jgi:MFS family permease